MRIHGGIRIDDPAYPVLQATISFVGVTDGTFYPDATRFECAGLANEPIYTGQYVKILDGSSAGQIRPIGTHGGALVEVTNIFTDNAGLASPIQIGTRFMILSGAGGIAPAPAIAPSIGLWMFGQVSPLQGPWLNRVDCPNLAGLPDDIFNDEFWMQVIHNDDAPGTAPERDIRRITDYTSAGGIFNVDPFSAQVEPGDLVCVFHESLLSSEILGFGTLTVSSATVPADGIRTEGDNYFNGCLLMTTEGAVRFQPRRIVDYTGVGGIFTLDPSNPFTAAPGLVDYVIIGDQTEFIPPVDGTGNRIPSEVIGGKADTPIYVPDNVSSIIRYLKGLLNRITVIWNIVLGILVTTETGGTITTDGTEQDVYINNAPAGVFEPLKVMIDMSNQLAAMTTVVRVRYRIRPAGSLILKDQLTFAGVQSPPLKNIELEPNRYGIQVTLQRTAGVAADYDWGVFYRV